MGLVMKNLLLQRILKIHFPGASSDQIENAALEIEREFPHLNDKSLHDYKPACLDPSDENLIDGCCVYCKLPWYNCSCSDEN